MFGADYNRDLNPFCHGTHKKTPAVAVRILAKRGSLLSKASTEQRLAPEIYRTLVRVANIKKGGKTAPLLSAHNPIKPRFLFNLGRIKRLEKSKAIVDRRFSPP
jgi:hypothetical protein